MFAKPIVFVVGDGASAEFDLPVGSQLRDGVAMDVLFRFNRASGEQTSGDPDLFAILNTKFRPMLADYRKAGDTLSSAMKPFPSIDEALHYFSEDQTIVSLGKLAVALRIFNAEKSSSLPTNDNQERRFNTPESNWLFELLSMTLAGTRRSDARALFTNVTIINFNYDRTVEHFLFHALQRNAALTEEAASESIEGLRILRPYGKLGPLPWQDRDNGLRYGGLGDRSHAVTSAAKNIRTFTEQFAAPELRAQIQSVLAEAKAVVFLGFGFHKQNMALLSIENAAGRSPKLFATCRGIHPANHEAIIARIEGALSFQLPRPAGLFDLPASIFMRDIRIAIMERVG